MAKKQTRRSVSIRGTTYDRIRNYCEKNGISMSEFVEARIAEFFDGPMVSEPKPSTVSKPVPRPKPVKAAPKKVAKGNGNGNGNGNDETLSFDELQDAARYFTF
jgi:hypothetical protein